MEYIPGGKAKAFLDSFCLSFFFCGGGVGVEMFVNH